MSLAQIAATAAHADFRNRVQSALYKAAVQVVGEDTSAMSATKGVKRHQLGIEVLNGSKFDAFVKTLASQVGEVADPTTILDATIEASVTSVWDDLAGVRFTE